MSSPLLPVATAISGGVREDVGWFRYVVSTDTWTWSAGLFEIHGFKPGEIVPTSAIFVAHKHPDDRSHTDDVMAAVLATGQPFCCRHRIIDSQRRIRTVVSIGQGIFGEGGEVTEVYGYFVDITDTNRQATELEIRQSIAESAATRADIEQAKGALMLIHGISAEDAFAVLRWHSQHANIKIRTLATIITSGIASPTEDGETPSQRIGRILSDVAPGYRDGAWRDQLMLTSANRPAELTA